MDAYDETLQRATSTGLPADLTEENLQARIRGNLLMALSNKFGWLVLDDRQQVGDVRRLHHPLRRPRRRVRGHQGRPQDARLPALRVAQLARRRRCGRGRPPRASAPIPASIIERAPSAELRHDQRDEDSLPPYELLDRILTATSSSTTAASS